MIKLALIFVFLGSSVLGKIPKLEKIIPSYEIDEGLHIFRDEETGTVLYLYREGTRIEMHSVHEESYRCGGDRDREKDKLTN